MHVFLGYVDEFVVIVHVDFVSGAGDALGFDDIGRDDLPDDLHISPLRHAHARYMFIY